MEMASSENNIGILGGSFDPPHIGHLIIAETARQKFNLKKIIFIPSGIPPHKSLPVTGGNDRSMMVKLAIEDNRDFEVLDTEIIRPGISYTLDTVMEIRSRNEKAALFLILGFDAFGLINKWKSIDSLCQQVTFLVARRYPEDNERNMNIPLNIRKIFLDNPYIDISSSFIRKLCREKKSIKYLVPETVREYIERNNLYG
jgi:nicotinate-nucleotide adenylyltransferase